MTKRPLIAFSILLGGFGFFGLLALFVTDAHAGCPPPTGYRTIGNTCTFTNGVEIDSQVNHTGNLQTNPKTFSAEITAGDTAVLFCLNKGGNQPPGQRIIPISLPQPLTCSTSVTKVVSNQNGGIADVVCPAVVPRCDPKCDLDLADFDQFCSNGQFAADLVPIFIKPTVKYSDTKGTINKFTYTCELLNPETLGWNKDLKISEKRAYDNCSEAFDVQ